MSVRGFKKRVAEEEADPSRAAKRPRLLEIEAPKPVGIDIEDDDDDGEDDVKIPDLPNTYLSGDMSDANAEAQDMEAIQAAMEAFTLEADNPWDGELAEMQSHHANRRAKALERALPVSALLLSVPRLTPFMQTEGDVKSEAMDAAFFNLGIVWTAEQLLVYNAIKRSMLMRIHGRAGWEKQRVKIMAGLSDDEKHLFGKPTIANMPRQFGKSTLLRAVGAVILAVLAGTKAVVFGPAKRTSHVYMDGVVGFLNRIPGATERIVQANSEELRLALTPLTSGNGANSAQAIARRNLDTTSVLNSYPSSEKGTFIR
jgi:hypothetical protein